MLRQYKLIRISNKLFLLSHCLRKQNSWRNSSKILCLTKTMGIYVLKGLLKKLFWVALSIQNKNADSWLQKKKTKTKKPEVPLRPEYQSQHPRHYLTYHFRLLYLWHYIYGTRPWSLLFLKQSWEEKEVFFTTRIAPLCVGLKGRSREVSYLTSYLEKLKNTC